MNDVDGLNWDVPLHRRRGADWRLCGIWVYHEFDWDTVFGNGRAQFRNGRALALQVVANCPDGLTPALLLTQRTDIQHGVWQHPKFYVVVVNIDRYLGEARADPAATYFATLSDLNPFQAARITIREGRGQSGADLVAVKSGEVDAFRSSLLEDPAARKSLIDSMIDQDGLASLLSGRERETFAAAAQTLGPEVWRALEEAGMGLPSEVAHQQVWRERHQACGEFRTHLDNGDWDETRWQRFFEEQTWIFGYGLSYQFLHVIAGQPYLGGRDFRRTGGQEGDFLMATQGSAQFTVLVEIKRPNCQLVGTGYRNGTWPPSQELARAVAQVQAETWRWATDGSRTTESRDQLEPLDIYTHEPRGILVIGNLRALARSTNGREKLRGFESFRRNLWRPEVLTFDELLYRARRILNGDAATIEKSQDS